MIAEASWLLERAHAPLGLAMLSGGLWAAFTGRGWIGRLMGIAAAQVAAVLMLLVGGRANGSELGEAASFLVLLIAAASLLGCALILRLRAIGGAVTPQPQSNADPDA